MEQILNCFHVQLIQLELGTLADLRDNIVIVLVQGNDFLDVLEDTDPGFWAVFQLNYIFCIPRNGRQFH